MVVCLQEVLTADHYTKPKVIKQVVGKPMSPNVV